MTRFNSKTAISIATLLASVVWIYLGLFKYGLLDESGSPASGLFPVIVASVLCLCSVIGIVQSFGESHATYERQALYVLAAIVAILAMNWVIGLMPALLLFYVGWLVLIEKMPIKIILISTVFMSAIVYGVFKVWLGVPFPEGIVFEALLR